MRQGIRVGIQGMNIEEVESRVDTTPVHPGMRFRRIVPTQPRVIDEQHALLLNILDPVAVQFYKAR
jgi:hypothetical protein